MIDSEKNYDINSLDTCEAGRFSCYIFAEMMMVTCSFDTTDRYETDLRKSDIQSAYDSEVFDRFRLHLSASCSECTRREDCLGGCSLMSEIVLCNSEHRRIII
jgi:radical SAM protein with 4Fe4S-binding SPASM domain